MVDAGASWTNETAVDGRVLSADRIASGTAGALLQPGRNCWRVETASRAACLVDGEAYFAAAKQALLRASHSVLLLGWDFVERVRLEPDRSDPEWPDALGEFLKALVERRQGLRIHVLVWDKVPLLALGMHRVPGSQTWDMNEGRLCYRLDPEHPALATHHQKVLVIDDAVAFCGGFDFAGNRWDTRAHAPRDPRRKLPTGAPYEPHHDVAMAVEGPAARALGDLARERWQMASGERLDRLLRIGSSNLNSRSMGVDTECDLAIEAGAGPADAPRRQAILAFRDDLIAEHLGVSGPEFARAVAKHGSVVRAIDALNGTSERRLAAFPSPRSRKLHWAEHNRLTDPLGPNRPLVPHAGLGWHPGITIGLVSLVLVSGALAFRWMRKRAG